MRGSPRSRAVCTSCASSAAVSMVADRNTKSRSFDPNSGRIGRSPGYVARMRRIACSISSSRRANAIPPRASPPSGNAHPAPTKSYVVIPVPVLRSVELDHLALDLHDRVARDLHPQLPRELELAVALSPAGARPPLGRDLAGARAADGERAGRRAARQRGGLAAQRHGAGDLVDR